MVLTEPVLAHMRAHIMAIEIWETTQRAAEEVWGRGVRLPQVPAGGYTWGTVWGGCPRCLHSLGMALVAV